MNPSVRSKVRLRVKRVAGQVAGIERMIEKDRYCVDILNQIAVVRSALNAVGLELLNAHLEGCVLGHGTPGAHADARSMAPEELLAEVRGALKRFLK
jgi:DNA-binding FrmR family transcriptional regulator